MSVRDKLLSDLSKEILGPRSGINEIIYPNPQGGAIDPGKEYITGVLEPSEHRYPSNNSYFSNEFANKKNSDPHQDDSDEDESSAPTEIYTSLDPRSLPKSLGMSFLLANNGITIISICASWARYLYDPNSKTWKRYPNYHIIKNCNVLEDNMWASPADPGIKIHLKHSFVNDGIYVSVFLVNETKPEDYKKQNDASSSSKIPTEDLVFQPQIRIVCDGKCKLLPIQDITTGKEEETFSLLYRNHSTLTRGHFCSTVWKEVDPEILSTEELKNLGHPFRWIDGDLLEKEELTLFDKPDIRTEYMPIFGLEQPSLDAINYNKVPTLQSKILAEAWEIDQISNTLEPLVENYSTWIKNTESKIDQLDAKYKNAALSNMEKCKVTLKRIENGLNQLKSSEDTRLAFCFMNMAMYKQSIWKDEKKPLQWRPFQLAFILQ